MMNPMNNLNTAVWWKRVLYFIPFLLAAVGLAVWYAMNRQPVQTPMTVALGRGKIIGSRIEDAIEELRDFDLLIYDYSTERKDLLAEIKELSRKVGIRDEELDRAIADGDFDTITNIIRSEHEATGRDDDNP